MISWAHVLPSLSAAFLASLVEFMEALTVVLAVGTVRGWRPALFGTGLALGTLGLLVLALGPALTRIPIEYVQVGVGSLLLLFGLRWLRKAILRGAGVIALHDAAATYAGKTALLESYGSVRDPRWDTIAISTSFEVVMLEGIEVVFIVIAVGAAGGLLVPAGIGAGAALVVVMLLGLVLRRPLANMPENALKFAVGVLLAAFGSFWVGEGIGVEWPADDWSLLGLIGWFLLVALAAVRLCRARRSAPAAAT